MRDRGFFPPSDDQNPFTDVLFNALLGFAFMFSVAFIMIRPEITEGKVNPNLIIRTSVGSQRPLFPGHQHIGNMSDAYRKMLSTVEIIELEEPEDIFKSYKKAYERKDGFNTILVEYGDFYNEK